MGEKRKMNLHWYNYPVIPFLVIAHLSKSFSDNNKRAVGASIEVFYTEISKNAVKSNRMTESEVSVSDELLLRNLKMFDGEYLTRAAILLFHPTPEHYVTGAYTKIGYFSLVGAFGGDA